MRFKSECRQPRERLPETKVTILRRIRQRETKNIYDGARTFASGNDRAGKQILRCAQNDISLIIYRKERPRAVLFLLPAKMRQQGIAGRIMALSRTEIR